MKKRILSVVLVLALCMGMFCTLPVCADAASTERNLQRSAEKLRQMDLTELNAYIDDTIAEIETLEKLQTVSTRIFGNGMLGKTAKAVTTKLSIIPLKLVWLAAAQAIRLAGCPCAAKLMECSVLGLAYEETMEKNGLFRNKIVQTKTFKGFLAEIKSGTASLDRNYVLSHERSESFDLYYSLHACTYKAQKSGNQYEISVYDRYDFAYMEDDSFTAVINNWAWLCQNAEILEPIDVNIRFAV